jgi:DNA-binding response OmpR family regulator
MAIIGIIDDSEHIRRTIRMVLEKEGHEVFEAANGIEGEALITEKKLDIILLDIVMPQKSGCDILLSLKNNLKNTDIIILTGNVDPESDIVTNVAKQFHIKTILLKPFRKNQLLEVINTHLKKKKEGPPADTPAGTSAPA